MAACNSAWTQDRIAAHCHDATQVCQLCDKPASLEHRIMQCPCWEYDRQRYKVRQAATVLQCDTEMQKIVHLNIRPDTWPIEEEQMVPRYQLPPRV
eukprot:6199716-Amphidinium_carterae.1